MSVLGELSEHLVMILCLIQAFRRADGQQLSNWVQYYRNTEGSFYVDSSSLSESVLYSITDNMNSKIFIQKVSFRLQHVHAANLLVSSKPFRDRKHGYTASVAYR